MDKIIALKHLQISIRYVRHLVSELADLVTESIEALENGKAGKPAAVNITIPNTGWLSDNMPDYPKYYDFAVNGVTAQDKAALLITPNFMGAAIAAGFCPVCETLVGKIRFRAVNVPAVAIVAQYWLDKGKE